MKKKQITFVLLFLGMFIVGTVLIFHVPMTIKITYGNSVQTDDGETISFNVFEPKTSDEKKKKAVIIGHGVMVNKEMMKGYAIELAAAGYVAVPIDFRGHGQSSGDLNHEKLVNDVEAVKGYLAERDDIDIHNLGYIGYSMGGWPGNEIVKNDEDFKAFIGVGTSLAIKKDDIAANRTLNILMILAQFDQAFSLNEVKEQFGDYIGKDTDEIAVNRLYGSFQDGDAAKVFLDDNSDHLMTAWDQDFIREARDWVLNTFDEVNPADPNFYVNLRFLILILQLLGGMGFFFSICGPVSKFVLKFREDEDELPTFEFADETWTQITKRSLLYTLVFFIPGMILMIPLLLLLPLVLAGVLIMVLFGQAFGFLMYLWKSSNREEASILSLLKEPFHGTRKKIVKESIVGILLAVILYVVLYLSIGLNYLGIIPSIVKIPWMLIYFVPLFVIFIIFQLLLNMVLYPKIKGEQNSLSKSIGIALAILLIYLSAIILIPSIIMGNYFLTLILMVSIPINVLAVCVAAILYKKTGSIVPGVIIDTFILLCILSTLSPYGFIFSLISLFAQV
ncbi:MAG: alpha/beta hydrolase [Promethearchaeia archaeon]